MKNEVDYNIKRGVEGDFVNIAMKLLLDYLP